MKKGPRILLWDIETSHNIVAKFRLFGRGEEYTPHENILQERYIICAAWKWLGEKTVRTVSVLDDATHFDKQPHDDLLVVTKLHEVLASADVLVAHNGDAYDKKFFEARALFHGLAKLAPIKSVDTKKVAQRRLLFNNNRLDYLGQFLGVGRKVDHERGLWMSILRGGPEAERAIGLMVRYNKGDVTLLERVFLKLLPYVEESISRHLYDERNGCPRCGSNKVQSRGVHRAVTRSYQRFQCQSCGGWFRTGVITDKTTTRLVA